MKELILPRIGIRVFSRCNCFSILWKMGRYVLTWDNCGASFDTRPVPILYHHGRMNSYICMDANKRAITTLSFLLKYVSMHILLWLDTLEFIDVHVHSNYVLYFCASQH